MFHFGSGTLWGYPVAGNLAANPTPIKFGTLQDINLEISGALKELYGQNQFAEAVARGKCKITGKAKFAQIVGKHVNDLFFGQTMNSGQKLTALDEAQPVPSGSPYTITELGEDFYQGPLESALETARELYRSEYWRTIRGDEIQDQAIATKLLDMAVNMGVRQAIVLCQRALNTAGFQLHEDGVCGLRTLAAINHADVSLLSAHLRESCTVFYQHLAAVRPEAQQYLHGWLNRARA